MQAESSARTKIVGWSACAPVLSPTHRDRHIKTTIAVRKDIDLCMQEEGVGVQPSTNCCHFSKSRFVLEGFPALVPLVGQFTI